MRDLLPSNAVIIGGAVLLAIAVAAIELGNWDVYLRYLHQVPYNANDPIFGKDIGFFLFSLPAFIVVKNWALATLILSAAFAGAFYWLRGHISRNAGLGFLTPDVIAHGSALLGLFFAIKAWSYGLDRYLLLYGDNGVVVGASYTDVHIRLPPLWTMIGLSLAALFDQGGTLPAPSDLSGPAPVAGGVAEKAREALHHYHQALEHLKSGDWAGFGAQLDVMRATLETLNRAAGDR